MDEPFRHVPLDHNKRSIRLLQVCPGEGLIKCRLWETVIDTPDFICLSYTWGLPNEKSHDAIFFDGKRMSVRPNLYAFLKVARRTYAGEWLWIDAICIDQSSALEKNHQVLQMGDIYRNARMVLMWLGPGTASSDICMESLEQCEAARDWTLDALCSMFTPGASTNTSLIGPIQHLLEEILHNGYFHRSWIVQEVALAKRRKVVVGNRSVSWTIFRTLATRLLKVWESKSNVPRQDDLVSESAPFWTLDIERSLVTLLELIDHLPTQTAWQPLPLRTLVVTYSTTRRCEDTRDKIYSMLSLTDPTCLLRADYTLSLDQLFCKVVEETMRTRKCSCLGRHLMWLFENTSSGISLSSHWEETPETFIPSHDVDDSGLPEYLHFEPEPRALGYLEIGKATIYSIDGQSCGLPCTLAFATETKVESMKGYNVAQCIAACAVGEDQIYDIDSKSLDRHIKAILYDGSDACLKIAISSQFLRHLFWRCRRSSLLNAERACCTTSQLATRVHLGPLHERHRCGPSYYNPSDYLRLLQLEEDVGGSLDNLTIADLKTPPSNDGASQVHLRAKRNFDCLHRVLEAGMVHKALGFKFTTRLSEVTVCKPPPLNTKGSEVAPIAKRKLNFLHRMLEPALVYKALRVKFTKQPSETTGSSI
jgi:hypothetical protein